MVGKDPWGSTEIAIATAGYQEPGSGCDRRPQSRGTNRRDVASDRRSPIFVPRYAQTSRAHGLMSDLNEEVPGPDQVLAEHTRALAGAFRERLGAAYVDPQDAFIRFRDRAREGVGEAAALMRERPEEFGTLVDGGATAAGQAAVLGARAYQSRIAESDPAVAVEVLGVALAAVTRRAGIAPGHFEQGWQALRNAYGVDIAARLAAERPREVFGENADVQRAVQAVGFAAARDHLRHRAGMAQPPPASGLPPLPRSLRHANPTLAPQLQGRLVAAADGMRRRLARAYSRPLLAEARLHTLVARHGPDALRAVAAEPAQLGDLRTPTHGTAGRSAAVEAAVAYARIAYEYHAAGLPDQAAELAARDELVGVRRQARDTDRAMEGLHEAIQMHGPELEEHLSRARDRSRAPGRGEGGIGGTAGGERVAAPTREAAGGPPPDPVQEAVTAHERAAEVEELRRGTSRLRSERTAAERQLAFLAEQDRELAFARRDFLASARGVYQHPEAALARWDGLLQAEGGSLSRARERLLDDPARLGRLRSEPRTGLLGLVGLRTKRPARDAVPLVADSAERMTRARRAVDDPVRWTTPDGKVVEGRERVRERARAVVLERQNGIDRAHGRARELGGSRDTQETLLRRFDSLSPPQRREAVQRGGSGLLRTLQTARSIARQMIEAGRVVRGLAEGPSGP